jgi:CubicO group peptidase (beta-lactamase class C family)
MNSCKSPDQQIENQFGVETVLLDTMIKKIQDKYQLMGVTTLIIKNGQPAYQYHSGWAQYERKIPITDSTIFRIASISKTITSTALMILYDKGKFKLDDDIGTFLGYKVRNPKFPDVPITFKMLLTHTSTISDCDAYDQFLSASYKDSIKPSLKDLLTTDGKYYKPEIFSDKTPGTYFQYSNPAFGIIGTLVEKISSERFDLYCEKYIFSPLDMNANFVVEKLPNINNLASLYRMQDSVWTPQVDDYKGGLPPIRNFENYNIGSNAIIFAPQGGLRISARDLSKFMNMLANFGTYNQVTILSDTTVKRMLQVHFRYDGSNGDNSGNLFNLWGLGIQIISNTPKGDFILPETTFYGHLGEAYGLISAMFFDPKTKNGFISIINGSGLPYEKGDKSGFYLPEHELFQAIIGYGGF